MDEYHAEEIAHRVACDTRKHTFEKTGGRRKAKSSSGPSDAQSQGGKNSDRRTAGGIDANATKDHLYAEAKMLGISGRSTMTKGELVDALERESSRKTKITS